VFGIQACHLYETLLIILSISTLKNSENKTLTSLFDPLKTVVDKSLDLVAQVIKFRIVTPHMFSKITAAFFLLTYSKVYQQTCTEQKAPKNSEAHRSLHNCKSLVGNLLHVASWYLE